MNTKLETRSNAEREREHNEYYGSKRQSATLCARATFSRSSVPMQWMGARKSSFVASWFTGLRASGRFLPWRLTKDRDYKPRLPTHLQELHAGLTERPEQLHQTCSREYGKIN
jgi:hypothetical protein